MAVAEVLPHLTVVLGPCRSGKSRWAEHLAGCSDPGKTVHYLATGAALPDDASWQERLLRHRQRRPPSWVHGEVGASLAEALDELGLDDVALVDSLGSWVAHGLSLDPIAWSTTSSLLIDAIQHCEADLIVVSEQTGWGVVPPTAIGGLFRDRLGELEQELVALSSSAWLVVAGRAVNLSSHSLPVPELS